MFHSTFTKVLLLLLIIGGLNWGIYGIWGLDAIGWLLGGSLGWLARAVFIVVGLAALALIPTLFATEPPRHAAPRTPYPPPQPRPPPGRCRAGGVCFFRRFKS